MNRSDLVEFMLEKGFTFSEEIQKTLGSISKLQDEAKEQIQRGKQKIC
jgi:hypothetical protein